MIGGGREKEIFRKKRRELEDKGLEKREKRVLIRVWYMVLSVLYI